MSAGCITLLVFGVYRKTPSAFWLPFCEMLTYALLVKTQTSEMTVTMQRWVSFAFSQSVYAQSYHKMRRGLKHRAAFGYLLSSHAAFMSRPLPEGQPGEHEPVPSGHFSLKLTVVFSVLLKERDSFQLYCHPELADDIAVGMLERQAVACGCR